MTLNAREPDPRRPSTTSPRAPGSPNPWSPSCCKAQSKVSEKRRAAVLAAIVELGYRPSRAATTLASHRTKSVEVVIDDFRNLSFVDLLRGIESALSAARLPPHRHRHAAQRPPAPSRVRAACCPRNLDGLIIAGEPDVELLRGWDGPTVVAGWRTALPAGADLVANDDELGGRMAAEHLLGLGHRSIGHLTGTGGPAAHRREGFRRRLVEAGVDVPGRRRIEQGTSEEDGYLAAACCCSSTTPDITAIFAANDTMALGALAAIRGTRPERPGGRLRDRLRQLAAGAIALSEHHLDRRPQRSRRRRPPVAPSSTVSTIPASSRAAP